MGALDAISEESLLLLRGTELEQLEPWNRFRVTRARMMLHDVAWFLEHRRTPDSVARNPTGQRLDLDTHQAAEDELSVPGYPVGYQVRKSLRQLRHDAQVIARALELGAQLPEWAEGHVFSAYVDVDKVFTDEPAEV